MALFVLLGTEKIQVVKTYVVVIVVDDLVIQSFGSMAVEEHL